MKTETSMDDGQEYTSHDMLERSMPRRNIKTSTRQIKTRGLKSRQRRLLAERLEERLPLHGGDLPESFFLPPQHRLGNAGALLTGPAAGDPLQIALSFLNDQAADLGLVRADLDNYLVSDRYQDESSGITHLYLRQTFAGLEVINADLSIGISEQGEVIHVASSFLRGAQAAGSFDPQSMISATQAYLAVSNNLGLGLQPVPQIVGVDAMAADSATLLSAPGTEEDVRARLVLVPTSAGLELAWRLDVRLDDYAHWFDALVSAATGEPLSVNDQVEHATYNVFPRPVESPLHGSRAIVTDPQDATASPFGWHDTNGALGAEFLDTRGNNATVQEDVNADNAGGFRPAGGAGLDFNFPLDTAQDPALFQSAAITNAYYWVNVLHDIHYQYGFTEAAGNFQVNNYGHGGAANDPVIVDVQDGDGGSDSFVTLPDGQSPRMSLYRRDTPYRDRAYDSDILIHEFGHGISQRLTGGPSNTTALNGKQSKAMGEGWGDWWALMLTQVPADAKLDAYPIGNYAAGFPASGPGIRQYPYSFDMAVDPLTYNSYNGGAVNNEEHKAGAIWSSVLWDMNWLLIDKYGFSSDLYHGTGGNNIALQLVMDGLKLQGTNPSFLGGRDAILAADVALNGGQNQTEIWTAFARRGMGLSASDGGGANSITVVEAFDVPATISGNVFRDDDANGVRNGAEPGLAGWTVYRDKNNNGIVDLPIVATFNSTDTPRPIPDGANTLSNRVVSGLVGVIRDINVTVNLTHPYVGELYLTLISPANTPVIMANYLGGSGDNYTNTTFDDEAATYISAASPPFTGSFRPYYDFAQLDGRDPNGTWKLRMDDAVSGNTGTLLSWSLQITYGDPDPTTVTDANGNYSFFGLGNGTHRIREVVPPGITQTAPVSGFYDVVIAGGQSVNGRNFGNRPTFQASAFAATSTGVTVDFNRDLDPAALNLYDLQGGTFGPADVTLVGATTGAVRGSVVIDPSLRKLTFIRTAGTLPPDNYTLTLRSAADGFVDATALLLDGDADGLAGGNYVQTFTVNAPPANAVTLSVANFARGPQQPVNLPANGIGGFPISFSDGGGITSASFQLRYNPALLNITGAAVAPGLPVGATVNINTSTPGVAVIQFSSPTPLAVGTTQFIDLQSNVPTTAPYRAKHVLDFTNISLNSGLIPAVDDDALHIAAYFGDTTGNGQYSAPDAGRISRVAVGFDTGFQLYKLLDPMIIGDISGAGGISSTDASRMLQASVGFSVAEIPLLPLPAVSLVAGGPDPKLSIPTNLFAVAGSELNVPVHIDSIVDLTGTGLESADLVIHYDPAALNVTSVSLGSLIANQGNWIIASRIDDSAGLVVVSLAGNTPLEGLFQGELVQLHATVKANAATGPTTINLAASAPNTASYTQLNEGYLTLIPAPTNAASDSTDGLLTIIASPLKPMGPTPLARNAHDLALLQIVSDGSAQQASEAAFEPLQRNARARRR